HAREACGVGVNEWLSLANAKEKISKNDLSLLLEPISVIEPPEYTFKLSPFDLRSAPTSSKVKDLTINGNKIIIEALQAYEDDAGYNKSVCTADRAQCFKVDDWMVVSVNGTNVELAREDIVEIVFENNFTIYISAVDIEGIGSSAGSDLIIKKK
ncbi:MAG: hypothetical protein HYT47_02875, partial [Candidatus Vogelbacteria bacterium]|nr:hypothetical protein [Candidatus Vogelbacteria bacterium]